MESEEYVPAGGQQRLFEIFLSDKKQPKLVMTLAAPGTGKTTTVVQLFKALYSGKSKSPIKRVLFLTFTRRSRNDILKKFKKDGFLQKHPFMHRIVRSFHSLAYSTLFWDSILTETDITRKIKEIAAEAKLDVEGADRGKVNKLIKQINEAIAKGQIKQKMETYQERNATFANIFEKYIGWLEQCFKESLSISYDYSLIKLEQSIKNNQYPRMIDLNSLDLLIVDEFQDSNPAQIKIIRTILEKNAQMKLLLLGDIDQTIYTWRGADLVYLEELIEEFQQKNEYESVYLQNSHRLGSEVVEISQKLIKSRERYLRFRERHYQDKVPVPRNIVDNHATEVRLFQSQFSEVYWVFRRIKQLRKEGLRYRDITVLFRSFKLTTFLKKFQFLNEKVAKLTGQPLIPITLKSDQVNSVIKNVIAWIVYFYKKHYFPEESAKQEIKIILESMAPTKSTLDKMIEANKVDKIYLVRRNLSNKLQEDWQNFFNTFRQVKNKMAEDIEKQNFSDVFKYIYQLLVKEQIIEEANANDIEEFLDFTTLIQSTLDRQRRLHYPTYSIIQELIVRKYYNIDRERKKNNRKKVEQKKQVQIDLFGNPVHSQQKKRGFYQLILSKVRRLSRETILSQEEQRQTLEQKLKFQGKKDEKQIEFNNEQDSVQFQTTFRCKGLQYKAVFIVAMNYDIFQQQFDSIPRIRQNTLSDANRERQLSKQLTRRMLREEQELRVVYTAITRTSKYSFVSSSNSHNRSFAQGIKHPHFLFLQNNAKVSEYIPFDQQQDMQFKTQFQAFYQQNANPTRQTKPKIGSNQSIQKWMTPKKE